MDKDRCERVKPLLNDVLEQIETASIRLADAEDFIIYQGNNVMQLEEQVKQLEDELLSKKKLLKEAEEEAQKSVSVIETYFDRISGVGIR